MTENAKCKYLVSSVNLLFSLAQLFFLLREADELVKRFLVDVTVVLQFMVALFQLLE